MKSESITHGPLPITIKDFASPVFLPADEDTGRKDDKTKDRWDLLPYEEVEKIVKVLTFDAKKYADNNWLKVLNPESRYFAALQRHLVAWKKGEKIDPESGFSHLAHAGCCLLFLSHFDE